MLTRVIYLCCICSLLFSCNTSYEETQIAIDNYEIEDGFTLEVIAAEPLLKAPVAMDFDSKGRIWVVQMPGYMNDMQGSEEEAQTGSIRILEDLDNDGVADHTKIFLDSLIMPRALAHVYDGLLYAEPPYLWFVEIDEDKPANPVLVDSIYAVEGNPEHQPNGLLLNIDNWIYNAKSNFRYRRNNKGKWQKEPTTFRGQWGITHDNFGRLYYNDNSRILLGDYVLPNTLINNKYFTPRASVDKLLNNDQRVYPLHATAVNRGYAKGVLNADSVLVNATAACSPLVYRGGAFSADYDENVFVCLPEGNLIKRNLLTFTGDSTKAKQAWQGKEFLASKDEGFRPVNLNNGPDGSMYIVDMHRGMIGHHAYLSPYLKEKTKTTRLDTLINNGRILKVKRKGEVTDIIPDFDVLSAPKLVALLSNKNGWIRDRAQHFLIYKNMTQAADMVKNVALSANNTYSRIHALYVLEGWNMLDFSFLAQVMEGASSSNVIAHAILLAKPFATEDNVEKASVLFKSILQRNELELDLYLASTIGNWITLNEDAFAQTLSTIIKRRGTSNTVQEALVSSMNGMEEKLLSNKNLAGLKPQNEKLIAKLEKSIVRKENGKMNAIYTRKTIGEDNRTSGAKLFYQICASCHGASGQGIEGLSPPLINSEHVNNTERLALIMLHGLEGPVEVNGKQYDINLAMPGLIRNENITDKDIADIISYVTNAFTDHPKTLNTDRIGELRGLKSASGMEYTAQELKALTE